jgi:Fe-S-cluster-containing dehydrogenase component/DMSO reductase anchor subunit
VNDSLILQLLAEQQQPLSAVDEFARSMPHRATPDGSRYVRLLPASPPATGEQYGFEVDLDRCSGCKSCVTACHSLNGLDAGETWREVGLLVGGPATDPFMQHVTAACHHCLDPACLTACPVNAYEKDPLTGIVRHLDDQCFGCQYCTLACPYDVPKYHPGMGIVRKCDMCGTRLAVNEAPACVQACPHEAIAIRVVDTRQVRADAETGQFLPAAPRPDWTYPTTTYKTRRVIPRDTLPADYHSVSPQHPHWPLIIMLVLTQLSVGGFLVGLGMELWLEPVLRDTLGPWHATISLGFGLLAVSASIFHLGRPQYAYRAILGLGHSWLSREILAFGLFAGLAVVYASWIWMTRATAATVDHEFTRRTLALLVAGAGLSGVASSVMIYAVTKREYWSVPRCGTKFILTTIILGLAGCWLSLAVAALMNIGTSFRDIARDMSAQLCGAIMIGTALKLLVEAAIFRHLLYRRWTSLKRTAHLLAGVLSKTVLARFSCGFLGGIVMPALLYDVVRSPSHDGGSPLLQAIAVAILFLACLAGELLERYLFFAAVAAPRMPKGLRP